MAFKVFELKEKFGWVRLQSALESIQNAINERTPKASETIDIDEQPDGAQICVKTETSAGGVGGDSPGGGSGGTVANLYGALNGAPALYHLRQTSAPTPV